MASEAALATAGWFDTGLRNLADWDLWIRLARTSPPAWVPSLLVGYRIHGDNASRDTQLIAAEADILDRRNGVAVDRGELEHYLGVLCLRSGRQRDALRHIAAAARHGKVLPAGKMVMWMAQERLPLPLLHAMRRRQVSRDPWTAEAQAWLDQLGAVGR
jgi:hypothetical protein